MIKKQKNLKKTIVKPVKTPTDVSEMFPKTGKSYSLCFKI
jgi:hypothetical protein